MLSTCKTQYPKTRTKKKVFKFPEDKKLLEKWKSQIPMTISDKLDLVRLSY